ncbi:MAG: hypothetical protein KKD38_03280 [Candidatus Delongbacteria bacterium]|nr:hypothetical protein [Candidatus Delongbacteria bacterium]MCG2761481.1 hypothetical protein [Candidatus Delongbacteria bacterium]
MKILTALTLIMSVGISFAGEYSFDISEVENSVEKIQFSGNIDLKYSLLKIRDTSPFYKLQYQDDDLSDFFSTYTGSFYFNGDYQTKDIGVFFKTLTEYYDDSNYNFDFTELYGTMNFSLNSSLIAGKKAYNWGKGYAFNPAGFVNPVKDPENPELSQAGTFSVNYQFNKSLSSSALTNLTFDLTVFPGVKKINERTSELKDTDLAGKLYFLIYDTDVEVMAYYSEVNSKKIGADFAKNISTNLEIHGEFAYLKDQERFNIQNSGLATESSDAVSYLAGIRWLSSQNVTTILEYYHNQSAMNCSEFSDYYDYTFSADSATTAVITGINKKFFSVSNLMRDYVYLKLSYPEPFGWLYFTPSVYSIYNINDESLVIGMPLSYKPITNSEILLTPIIFSGKKISEYGSKAYQSKIELKLSLYF